MKSIVILEIILLVLVLAAVGFFLWQVNAIEPVAMPDPMAQMQPAATEEPAATEPLPEEPAEEPAEEIPAEEPVAEEPEAELITKASWEKALKSHSISADEYFLYDLTNDRFMIRSDPEDKHIYPASVTKLFTAYVALQHAEPTYKIKVGSEIQLIDEDSSIAYLKRGEVLTVEQLIVGMLLPSGNDAAYTLATGVGRKIAGDESLTAYQAMDVFVEQMNKDAKALGMNDSHFTTVDGNHSSKHYIGLADMVTVGRLALETEEIARYAAVNSQKIQVEGSRSITWINTNLLLKEDSDYYCEQATGLKTGFTTPAGYCLLASVRVGDRDLLLGVFGSDTEKVRYADTLLLLAQSFMLDIDKPVSRTNKDKILNEAA